MAGKGSLIQALKGNLGQLPQLLLSTTFQPFYPHLNSNILIIQHSLYGSYLSGFCPPNSYTATTHFFSAVPRASEFSCLADAGKAETGKEKFQPFGREAVVEAALFVATGDR